MKKNFEEGSELDGYGDLRPEDQAKIIKAWQDGRIPDEDIPESARKPADEDEEEKPKKAKRAPAKKKATASGGDAEERPKRKTAAAKVRSLLSNDLHFLIMVYLQKTEDDDDEEAEEDEEEEKPKKKRAPPKKKTEPKEKAAPKKRASKKKKEVGVFFFCLRPFVTINLFSSRCLMRSLEKISLKSLMMCLPAQTKTMNLRKKRRNLRRRLPPRNQLRKKPKLSQKRNPCLNRHVPLLSVLSISFETNTEICRPTWRWLMVTKMAAAKSAK